MVGRALCPFGQSPQRKRLAFKSAKQAVQQKQRRGRATERTASTRGSKGAGPRTPSRRPPAKRRASRGGGGETPSPPESARGTSSKATSSTSAPSPEVGKRGHAARPCPAWSPKRSSKAARWIAKRPASKAFDDESWRDIDISKIEITPPNRFVTAPPQVYMFSEKLLGTPLKKKDTNGNSGPGEQKQPAGSEPSTPMKPLQPGRTVTDYKGLGVVMLEDDGVKDESKAMTRVALLSNDHMLLPAPVVGRAFELCNQMVHLSGIWSASEADLSSDLWEVFLMPAAERAVGYTKAGEFAGAFAELLGVVLFTVRQDAWLRQGHAQVEEGELRSFFERMAKAWMSVLRQSDKKLGLAPSEGKSGGYRPRLLALLRKWQEQANCVLEEEGVEKRYGKEIKVNVIELPIEV